MTRAIHCCPNSAPRRIRQINNNNNLVEARLFYPDQPGKKISLLKGEVAAQVAYDVQHFEVDDLQGTHKIINPIAHCTIKTTLLKTSSETYRVTLECTRDALSDDRWLAMMSRVGEMSIEDSDGHSLTMLSISPAMSVNDKTFTAVGTFSRNPEAMIGIANPRAINIQPQPMPALSIGEASKLKWNVATSFKSVTIPIEFKDLPMP